MNAGGGRDGGEGGAARGGARSPRAFRIEPAGEGLGTAEEGAEITETPDVFAPGEPTEAEPPARRRRFSLFALAGSLAFGLAVLAATNFVLALFDDLASRTPALGWAAAALAGLLGVVLVILALREWLAIRRLDSVEALRARALAAYRADDREAARRAVGDLAQHFARDPTSEAQRLEAKEHARSIIDGADLIRIGERLLLSRRDLEASEAIIAAAKRVSVVTALSPRAWFDVVFVLAQSIRLVRRIAELYGARPGGLGAVRLYRRVFGHLVITGGVAATESVLSQALGAGVVARLSAKLGEGVLNGILTARIGLAALEVLRPFPHLSAPPPRLGDIAARLVRGDGEPAPR